MLYARKHAQCMHLSTHLRLRCVSRHAGELLLGDDSFKDELWHILGGPLDTSAQGAAQVAAAEDYMAQLIKS